MKSKLFLLFPMLLSPILLSSCQGFSAKIDLQYGQMIHDDVDYIDYQTLKEKIDSKETFIVTVYAKNCSCWSMLHTNLIDYISKNHIQVFAVNYDNFHDASGKTLDNFNLNNNRFNYEVLEFNKLYPGIGGEQLLGYQFKIKISDKETQQFVTTNDFTKYVWLRNGESTTPPTAEVEMQNEINRINSLSLSLKNPILTQEEVNNINQNNILQNINGWVEGTGFFYEIINFSNSNNQFK